MDGIEGGLAELIARGEGETVEFKKSLAERDEALQTLAAFASQDGGTLCFGASPKGEPVGVDIGGNTVENLVGAIKAKIHPAIFPSIRTPTVSGKKILAVRIEPTGRLHTCDGRFYIRVGSVTLLAGLEEYQRRHAQREGAPHRSTGTAPDLRLELRREPEIASDGVAPSFVVSLAVENAPRAALADWWSFQLELPFAPPMFSEAVGPNRLLRPVLGRERDGGGWKHWRAFTHAVGELWVNFRSEGSIRIPPAGSEILGQFLLRAGWYGFDCTDGELQPSPGAEPVPFEYACRYELQTEAGPSRSGALSLLLYKLLPGRH